MLSLPRLSAGSLALAVLLLVITTRSVRAAGTTDDHDQFRSSVFACEGAVAHLVDCCPRFDAKQIACTYDYEFTAGACDSPDTTSWQYPAISDAQSRCILATSCEQLRKSGVCDRAQQLDPPRGYSSSTPGNYGSYSGGTEAGTVCP